ncbi:MAG: hypothetical protein ACREM8_13995, partial [Vulcanimicrobiaceae bacterium]
DGPTVLVRTPAGAIDARAASDLIAKLSGKAYWRKLYVEKASANVGEAREICNAIVAQARSVRG